MYYIEKVIDDFRIYVRDTKDGVLECYNKESLFSIIMTYRVEVLGASIPNISEIDCLCLYNKDRLIAHIFLDKKGIVISYEFVSSIKPFTFNEDFGEWLEGRLLINERTYVKDFFNYLGVSTYTDYAYITHFVSLTDTYWIRGYLEQVRWDEVSPYINEFNDVITHYSFDGKLESKDVGGSSPDMSLGGSFPKCWRRKGSTIEMIKAGTTFASNAGREPFSEVYVAQLEDYLGVYDYLPYNYIKYKGLDCTSCKLMTSEKIGLISARDLLKTKSASYSDLFRVLKSKDDIRKLKEMLCIDILTVNIDRHLGNIGFFINNDTQEVLGLAPIFDNNMALIPYYDKEYNGDLSKYIDYYCAKDGTDFIDLYKIIKDDNIIGLVKKALTFNFRKIVDSTKVDEKRLKLLTEVVHYQAKRCFKA